MKKLYFILVIAHYSLIIACLLSGTVNAQVSQEWVATYGDGVVSSYSATSIAVDRSGNVYVTGRGQTLNYDYVTIKYNSSGVQQWIRRYNGPGNNYDYVYAIAIDDSSNVYVTGWSQGKGTNIDYATIKYNSAGETIWVKRYNGPVNGRDGANSIAVDGLGNVYVTGVSYRSGFSMYDDYLTIKYNSVGDTIWVKRYNGPGNWYDGANSIAIDGSGNVYVTGYSSGIGTNYDYATIKYNSAGDTIWVRRYNAVNGQDYANSLAVDGSGNAYVTGYSWGSGTNYDYATLKYNSSGVQQWVQRFNGPGNNADYANSMAVDNSGNVCVTGVIYGSGTDSDYATIKYNSAGVQQWIQIYNGPGNGKDYAKSLALDGSGNVYVTGWSWGSGTSYDFATIKYSATGIQQWIQRYHANAYDGANSITIDTSANIYVTGNSMGGPPHFGYRYATIKYSQLVGIQPISTEIPNQYSLSQNYPNPFNPVTKIRFDISGASVAQTFGTTGFSVLSVYDILGREIVTLINEQLKPGTYEVEFDGFNYPSGVYYYKLTAGDFSQSRKMILVK